MNLKILEDKLGYSFNQKALLRLALTHASAAEARTALKTYQRLEFLGDRVLGLSISDYLFEHYPKAEEGELSKRLTSFVRKEACANRAKTLLLGGHIILGAGEAQSGGREKPAILADVMEAVLGAIFVDSNYETVKQVILKIWQPLLDGAQTSFQDPKTALQEWAHTHRYGNPAYEVIDKSGPDHNPNFTMQVVITDDIVAIGQGSSKREAEQNAAKALLSQQDIITDQ